ncbi:MAG: ABC transporter permease, partial [Rhodobacteraceae bacterium]|nr:ABC transporter permease [Paracoccaceae bacterium]
MAYIFRRLLWTLPTLLLVAIMVFFLVRLVPGDPAQLILGDQASVEDLAALRARLGLDHS